MPPPARPFTASVATAALLAGCLAGTPPDAPPARGLVIAQHPIAAEAGAAILRGGGNAADAAAAVQWALNVVEPPQSGIGGGTFFLYYQPATGRVTFLDGRETAPAAATADQFLDPVTGEPMPFATARSRGLAVGVPGTVRLFATALERFGSASFAATLAPAIRLAEDGVPVDAYLAERIADHADLLRSWPASARVFLRGAVCPPDGAPPVIACVGGEPVPAGTRLPHPDLARTFRLLAERGPDAFYDGDVARAIVETAAARDGRLAMEDLAAYEVVEREPLRVAWRGLDVVTAPPPSSALAVLQTIAILDGLGLPEAGQATGAGLHLAIEAMRLAYADRAAFIGDPSFVRVPVRGLLDSAYLAERRALIDPLRANAHVTSGDPWRFEPEAPAERPRPSRDAPEGGHTSHYVVVDRDGNVAAVTTTIESLFGTGMIVPGYGFLLNNQLTDFDFVPGGANEVAPGKRPRSAMSPTIALRGREPAIALGSPGGATIVASVAQVLLDVVEHGMALDAAVRAPRVYAPTFPGVRWESGISVAALAALERLGHEPEAAPSRIGQVQAAMRVGGAWIGVADDRHALGGVAEAR